MAAQVELKPGSVLVLDFDIRSAQQSGNAGSVDTTHRIVNHDDTSTVAVKLIRVCGGVKSFGGEGLCAASDREISLTAEQTVVYDVRTFFSLSRETCPTGYILAYAANGLASDTPIVFDKLSGTVQLSGNVGSNRRAGGAAAVAFQTAGAQVQGANVAGATGAPAASLPFNNTGYVQVASNYSTDFLTTSGNGNQKSELSLATLDIQAGAQNSPTLVNWRAYNELEEEFSGSVEYVCHVRVRTDDEVGPVAGAGMQGGNAIARNNFGTTFGKINLFPFGTDAIVGWITEYTANRMTYRNLIQLTRNPDRSTTFITN
jgi:hypothetical protein